MEFQLRLNEENNSETEMDGMQETSIFSNPVTTTTGLADFVDINKDPQHYVDRILQ